MASAKPRTIEQVVKESVVDGVTLELTNDEANMVLTLVGACAANGPTGPIFNALANVLDKVGGEHYSVVDMTTGQPVHMRIKEKSNVRL